MSTFDGRVFEFPDIRIDYFRRSSTDSKPALAYFLSHVHSDHLVGLESCKSPFIYCSPATRDILLRLEKYPHRMNFAKGILETRRQTYRHLKNLLKAIPLETPTVIELCPGAVAFLIEGDGTAVLYTGDVRSEPWWVNTLTRHPVLLPYVCSSGSEPGVKLDRIYLDTTFVVTGKKDPYAQFPSKAEGLKELLQKVKQYPEDTLFYLDAWTFGYEDVWQALSSVLGTRVHVDDYRYGLYRALANGTEPKAAEAAKTMGFHCGNHFQQGFLSAESRECRIHSCEKGTGCAIWNEDFVRITPIVSRHNGIEIAELGAGGGQGDLNQQHELEVYDTALVGLLMSLCVSKLQGQPQLLSAVLNMLTSFINDGVQSIKLEDFDLGPGAEGTATDADDLAELDDIPLDKLVPTLAKVVTKQKQRKVHGDKPDRKRASLDPPKRSDGLPRHITFPYSRHSSYNELCQLVEAFKPKDIHPCTVDEKEWTPASSMGFLFGHIYTVPPTFRHDQMMLKNKNNRSKGAESSSRPASSESSSSDYATPKSFPSLVKSKPAPAEPTKTPKIPSRHDELDSHREESMEIPSTKRKRVEGRRVNVDHYSPPRDKKRDPSTVPSDEQNSDEAGTNRSAAMLMEGIEVDRMESRWRKPIAQTMPPEWQYEDRGEPMKNLQNRQSLNYGRLSPSLFAKSDVKPPIFDQDHFDKLAQRPQGPEAALRKYSLSKESSSSSTASNRLAFRQEVHDAVLGKNGATWSDIGLPSVNGYHIKEEEL